MSTTERRAGSGEHQDKNEIEPDLFDPPSAMRPFDPADDMPAGPQAAPEPSPEPPLERAFAELPETLRRDMPLVPADGIAGRALVTVVAILTFLAALTAGAAELVARASSDWRASVAREMTIQIRPDARRNIEADVAAAAEVARGTAGIADVRVFDKAEAERLLEPWLGRGLSLAELPVPRLIVLKLAPDREPDIAALRTALTKAVPNASLDNHHRWTARLSAMADTLVAVGVGIVILVMTAAALAVAFATRGAMAGNKDIIEVLHFVGADDRFVARQFQARFLQLGLKGGAIGGALAIVLIALFGFVSQTFRASPGGDQIEAMFGAFTIGWDGYAAVAAIALVVALVTAAMSRITVQRHLARIH